MTGTRGAGARLAGAALFVLVGGCSRGARQGEATPPSATAQGAPGSAAPRAEASPLSASVRPESPRRTDPLWVRAKDEDLLERARLAEAVGAAGLLEGLEDGGDVAETALSALPYAPDADAALRRLGEVALASEPAAASKVVEVIAEIAGQPPRAREALDPEGMRACGDALITLAGRATLERATRARVISAARALAEKGYVDPARIPGDLDPP